MLHGGSIWTLHHCPISLVLLRVLIYFFLTVCITMDDFPLVLLFGAQALLGGCCLYKQALSSLEFFVILVLEEKEAFIPAESRREHIIEVGDDYKCQKVDQDIHDSVVAAKDKHIDKFDDEGHRHLAEADKPSQSNMTKFPWMVEGILLHLQPL